MLLLPVHTSLVLSLRLLPLQSHLHGQPVRCLSTYYDSSAMQRESSSCWASPCSVIVACF